LSAERRKGSVALVWSLGPDAPGALDRVAPTLGAFDTVVVVTDGLDFRRFVEGGWRFEALPGPDLRARAPGRDWSRYLARRVARIRADWAPDFETVLGQAPDDFVAVAARAPKPFGDPALAADEVP
jgi:hypothetical protein